MDKKQLKRIFNKNIIKDKSFIKMVCFTIVLLLVLVLGSNFGYVSADSGYDWGEFGGSFTLPLNYTDYVQSSIYNSSMPHDFFAMQTDYIGNYNSTQMSYLYAHFNEITSTSSYSNWVITSNTSQGNFSCYFFDDNIYYMNSGDLCCLYSTTEAVFDEVVFSIGNNSIDYINSGNHQLHRLGNTNYYNWDCQRAVLSNTNLYGNYVSWQGGMEGIYLFADYLNGGNSNFENFNYILVDGGYNQGSQGGANPSNYMYADYADWYLNNYNGDVAGNFRNMSVSFTTNLNNYINNQLSQETGTSSSDWVIYVDYSSFIDFYYKSVTDYGNVQLQISLPENFASVSYTTPDISSSTVYHWAATYEFPLYNNSDLGYNSAFDNVFHSPYNGYTTGFFMDGYKFANNANYVWTCPFSGLFAYMTPTSNSKFTNSNGVTYSITASLYEIMQMVDANMINWSPEYEGLNQFKLTCDAQIMYVGDDDSVDYTSGWYSETFNLLTGESITGSNAMLTNYNPYIDNTSDDYSSNLPSTSSGSSSTSVTTGNVTQTVTVSNEGAKYIPSIISSLIPSSFGDTSTGLASRFTTLVDSNNFITVMANTVPAIPTTVWTYLTEYLGISLYLLACAFVLRLILDLL